jgi:hypothetical protein
LDDQGIELIRVGAERTTPFTSMSEEVVLDALNVILDTRNYPLCLMCDIGRHRSGAWLSFVLAHGLTRVAYARRGCGLSAQVAAMESDSDI